MRERERGPERERLGVCVAVAATLIGALAGCVRDRREPAPGVLTVSVKQEASWVRNFNPLSTSSRWAARCAMYEPMLIFNVMSGDYEPWLATDYAFEDDNLTLRFTLREGVEWSDGSPLVPQDVVTTFRLLRDHAALDLKGVWKFLVSVEADGERDVVVRFKRVYVPGLADVAQQPIVPDHIWREIDDPVIFANPEPVGTGPFTEVRVFKNQIFELDRNPRYWQPGKPAIRTLRFPAFPGNEQANMALVNGEVDWAANFVPAIDRVFVAKDPEHHEYWFPLVGSTIFLYANTRRPPFDQIDVRKAISLALDRERIVEVAMFNYTVPADPTGLSDAFSAWRDPDAQARADWVAYDPARARELLDGAGIVVGDRGVRRSSDGDEMSFEILVVGGWSDWVRAAQVSARQLREIGIDAKVRLYDFPAWFDRVQNGNFDLAVGWSYEGPTPYIFYRWLIGSQTVKPIGVPTRGNWHRFSSAAADEALAAMETTTDPASQRRAAAQLQRVFAETAPAVPLFPGPAWGVFNTRRFVDFPSAENPYASSSPNAEPGCLVPMTRIRPRPEASRSATR